MVIFFQKCFLKREVFFLYAIRINKNSIKFCNKIGIFEKNSFLKRSISGEKVRLKA